jgi:hypothetical protein
MAGSSQRRKPLESPSGAQFERVVPALPAPAGRAVLAIDDFTAVGRAARLKKTIAAMAVGEKVRQL